MNRVRNYLNLLQGENMIVRDSDNTRTLITIVNYQKYQGLDDFKDTPTDTPIDTLTNTLTNTPTDIAQIHSQIPNKNEKNDKNEKKSVGEKRKRFIPPTLEEVQAYVKERNSSVDPKRFYEYYETGGWKDGKGNPVKNWKQKLITWEKKDTSKSKVNDFPTVDRDFSEIEKRIYAN